MSEKNAMLALLLGLQRRIRDAVVDACAAQSVAELSAIADDGPGDTIYKIDRVSEALLVDGLEEAAAALGGILLVAEGLEGGEVSLPRGRAGRAKWRFIVDPIDGTRGIMYQKRSAWVLSGIAPNRGDETRLSDIVVAAQTEIPTLKQHLCDELWAVRGEGAQLRRVNRFSGEGQLLPIRPSRASSLAHGYAMLTRFFPGARDELAAIDEEIMLKVLGASPEGKALCFEDQYASTGGQLYELSVGHDRFNADLRPLMRALLEQRGQPRALCCHPYDVCTALIAEEAGVLLSDPWGAALDVPLNVTHDVAWVGYANSILRGQVEPVLQAALHRRGLTAENLVSNS
jgi:fructose-1,6-bisphosphatase/inositol monophosphatase family enzyme